LVLEPLGPGAFGQLPDEVVLRVDLGRRNMCRSDVARISGTRCRKVTVADGWEIHEMLRFPGNPGSNTCAPPSP
jgi:hypothetical protein